MELLRVEDLGFNRTGDSVFWGRTNIEMDLVHVLDVPSQPADVSSALARLETRGKVRRAHHRRVTERECSGRRGRRCTWPTDACEPCRCR